MEVLVRFETPATVDHPARLRAFLRHRDEPPTEIPFVYPPFAPRTRFETESAPSSPGVPAQLFLVPTPDSSVAKRAPEVELAHGGDAGAIWRLASEPTDWFPARGRVPSSGTLTASFYLVGGPDATAPPAGQYRGEVSERWTATLAAWDTDAPGPSTGSHFARDRELPPLPDGSEAHWFHRTTARTRVYLRPSTERLEPPGTVTTTLVNHSRSGIGAGDWSVYRLADGDWYGLGPLFKASVARFVPPGDRHRWQFALAHGSASEISSRIDGFDDRLGFLGGGSYAITAGTTGDGGRPAALVELDAPPTTVRPTGDARVRRHGDTTVVRADPPRERDEEVRLRTLVLDRLPLGDRTPAARSTAGPVVVDSSERLPRLIPEQAMQARGLRNTLPFAGEGVEQVRLRTTYDVARRALRHLAYRTDGRRFRSEGREFRLTVESTRSPAGTTAGTATAPTTTDSGSR